MAKIPVFGEEVGVPSAELQVRGGGGLLGGIAEGLVGAGRALINAGEVQEKLAQADDARSFMEFQTELGRVSAEAQEEAALADPRDASRIFQERLSPLRQRMPTAKTQDGQVRIHSLFDRTLLSGELAVRSDARQRTSAALKVQMQNGVEALSQQYLRARTDVEKQAIEDTLTDTFSSGVGTLFGSQDEADALRDRTRTAFRTGAAKVVLDELAERIAQTKDTASMFDLLGRIPGIVQGTTLDPEEEKQRVSSAAGLAFAESGRPTRLEDFVSSGAKIDTGTLERLRYMAQTRERLNANREMEVETSAIDTMIRKGANQVDIFDRISVFPLFDDEDKDNLRNKWVVNNIGRQITAGEIADSDALAKILDGYGMDKQSWGLDLSQRVSLESAFSGMARRRKAVTDVRASIEAGVPLEKNDANQDGMDSIAPTLMADIASRTLGLAGIAVEEGQDPVALASSDQRVAGLFVKDVVAKLAPTGLLPSDFALSLRMDLGKPDRAGLAADVLMEIAQRGPSGNAMLASYFKPAEIAFASELVAASPGQSVGDAYEATLRRTATIPTQGVAQVEALKPVIKAMVRETIPSFASTRFGIVVPDDANETERGRLIPPEYENAVERLAAENVARGTPAEHAVRIALESAAVSWGPTSAFGPRRVVFRPIEKTYERSDDKGVRQDLADDLMRLSLNGRMVLPDDLPPAPKIGPATQRVSVGVGAPGTEVVITQAERETQLRNKWLSYADANFVLVPHDTATFGGRPLYAMSYVDKAGVARPLTDKDGTTLLFNASLDPTQSFTGRQAQEDQVRANKRANELIQRRRLLLESIRLNLESGFPLM